jgi:hypothetical protein
MEEKRSDIFPDHAEDVADLSRAESTCTSAAYSSKIRSIKRKIDCRICLVLGLLYTIAVIDRVNLSVCLIRSLLSAG